MTKFTNIVPDILFNIFNYLPSYYSYMLSNTCKYLRLILLDKLDLSIKNKIVAKEIIINETTDNDTVGILEWFIKFWIGKINVSAGIEDIDYFFLLHKKIKKIKNILDNKCIEIITERGHINVLKLFLKYKSNFGNICNYAALNGNLEILKWARTHGCYWDKSVYENAAKNGHLNILIYSRIVAI